MRQSAASRARYDALYLASALVPLGFVLVFMRAWTLDLSVPFQYDGDSIFSAGIFKSLIETGSTWTNPMLGAPDGASFYDYPSWDPFSALLARLFGLLGLSWGAVLNLFYLAGYALAGLAAAIVARRFGISGLPALAVATLFSLLPAHWFRGQAHIFIGMYWIVPFVALLLVWIGSDRPLLVGPGRGRLAISPVRDRRSLAALAIAAALGASSVYYLYFGAFLLLVAGLAASVAYRDARRIVTSVALIVVAAAVFAVQLAPTLIYAFENGRNAFVGVRNAGEAEVYGLRITHLLLPHQFHRISALAHIDRLYLTFSHDAATEARFAGLGIVASGGFLLLLSSALIGWPRGRRRLLEEADRSEVDVQQLGLLTIAAILLSTVAGFGAVIAAAISPQIRSYNRISVFIAFFALTALAVLWGRFMAHRKRRFWRVVGPTVLVATIVLGALDQTPADMAHGLAAARAKYEADQAFGREVQAALPIGASIFQLPYWPFPETENLYGMADYDPFRGYLSTAGFRWSYAAMKGRDTATWQQQTARLNGARMVQRLKAEGFDAIWVQSSGYADGGVGIRRELDETLGHPVAESADGVFAVWRISPG